MSFIWIDNKKYSDKQYTRGSVFSDEQLNYCAASFQKQFEFNKAVKKIDFKFAADTSGFLLLDNQIIFNDNAKTNGDFSIKNKKINEIYYLKDTVEFNGIKKSFFIKAFVQLGSIKYYDFSSGHGGLFIEMKIVFNDGSTQLIESDETWQSRLETCYPYPNVFDSTIEEKSYSKSVLVKNNWNLVEAKIENLKEEEIDFDNSFFINANSRKTFIVDLPFCYAAHYEIEIIGNSLVECVSYDLSITNWANGVKVGFEDTVADTGFALAKETKDGGKVIIAKTANDKVLVKMVSASYGLDISKEFVGEGYVNGTTPIVFYSTASDGDYFFRLNNFAFAESHDFVNESQSAIGLVNKQCSHCGLAVETTDLPEIDFAVNHYGATYLKGDSDDQHWKLGVSSAGIEYKLYGDPMTEFTLVMPKVNFNQFKDVSFEFEAPNWYENNGFGFTKEEAEGGTHHTTYGGSKTGTLSFGWEGEKLIATFDFEFISMSTEVTSAAVKSGEEGFKLYVTDAYDRSITLKKINLFTEHAYGDPVVSQDCIALSKQTCANGKHSTVSMPTIDFGANHFGATYLKDDNDDQHWKLGVSSDGIEYKLYGSEKTEFTLVLPKVKFTDFADVEFDLSAPNWYENNGFGFTKEEAEGGTHHTTYGGSKTGTLKFGWNDSELVATLSFGNLKMSTVVNDEEVKSGTKGFKLYVTDLYDRSLIVTDVKLFDEHSFGNQIVSSDKIATVKEKCSNGDHERSVGVPTIDFGTNHFGATYLKDDSDDQSWKLGVSSDGIAYNLYGDPMTEFTLVLPKVDFGNFTEVKFNLIASNWYENNGFGFTKAEAEGGTYHTTYGGSKDGTLTFSWNDNKLLVEFKFEHVEMSTEISDADVINGNNGFKLYVTNAYDRSIIVTNVNLQAK